MSAIDGLVITPKPTVYFGVAAIVKLPGIVRGIGADHVVVVPDAALAATPVVTTVLDILLDAGLADFARIAADAADDEVLLNTPCPPTRADIDALLSSSLSVPARTRAP